MYIYIHIGLTRYLEKHRTGESPEPKRPPLAKV